VPHCAPTADEVRALVASIVAGVEGSSGRGASEPAAEAAEGGIVAPPQPGEHTLADVAVGADHGGFHLKQRIAADLADHGWSVHDCGTESADSVDYPDFALAVARMVAARQTRWGIVVDGAGIGSAITANKVPGIRAATCWDVSSAKNSREHNHANVLCLGAGLVGEALALQIVRAWLSTAWAGGRHARRVSKIAAAERRYLKEPIG
jgi:ribose 5-phosphate isomerase B